MTKYRYPLLLAIVAIALPLIGAHFSWLDRAGWLHEPFFFTVPLGYALLAVAVVWAIVIAVKHHRQAH
ncbi:DUF3955 domain-containing protein [Lacticaseibacillus absianus]|uniref:DUF3955 domain-containing protein n=1 Tax=Lacticaseibacillus absianus TaxID=2729623 RepID=UPI0015C6EBF5|nr:DUF3955 domain-containing protein [Lacticaseibacillus absianus]